MKRARNVIAVLIALALIACMATTAFAAGTGSITINNAEVGQTYTVYKMADLISSSGDNYSYKVVDGWEGFFTAHNIPYNATTKLIEYTGTVDTSNAPSFAKAAVAYAEANSIAGTSVTADAGSVSFTGLDLGYYCINSSLGTVCALTTANPSASVNEKNGVPKVEKWVVEDSTGDYEKANDDSIGATVEYMTEVTVEAGAVNYIVTDTMSAGLTYGEVVSVLYGTTTIDYTLAVNGSDTWSSTMDTIFQGEDWTKYKDATFVLGLDNEDVSALIPGSKIKITYTATINENAVIGVDGNPNLTTLVYGNKPFSESEPSEAITYVWDLGVYKYTNVGSTKSPLAGAKFELYESDTNSAATATPCYLKDMGKVDGIPTYKHIHNAADTTGLITEIETDANGKFKVIGLDTGAYWLRETEAPDGYNLLANDIQINIVEVGDYTSTSGATLSYRIDGAVDGYVEVLNSSGVILPETGAAGTVIFITIGGLLMLTMGALLVIKKRMTKVIYTK